MDNINIGNGIKRIAINGNSDCLIEFDPTDVLFAEKFFAILKEFEAKEIEFQKRAKELDALSVEVNETGMPLNVEQGIAFLREVCTFMREKIDQLFGSGTSQKVFGDVLSIDMIGQFFEGITPFISQARIKKVEKYVNKEPNKKRVMK